jgi:hypothetical protein
METQDNGIIRDMGSTRSSREANVDIRSLQDV